LCSTALTAAVKRPLAAVQYPLRRSARRPASRPDPTAAVGFFVEIGTKPGEVGMNAKNTFDPVNVPAHARRGVLAEIAARHFALHYAVYSRITLKDVNSRTLPNLYERFFAFAATRTKPLAAEFFSCALPDIFVEGVLPERCERSRVRRNLFVIDATVEGYEFVNRLSEDELKRVFLLAGYEFRSPLFTCPNSDAGAFYSPVRGVYVFPDNGDIESASAIIENLTERGIEKAFLEYIFIGDEGDGVDCEK